MERIAQVLIIGAGPVGMTLALDLASRGVTSHIIEIRQNGEPPSVKCNHVAARSMEIFRRLGIAKTIRDAGLPADYPQDVSYRTTTTGLELARIRIPSREERFTDKDDGPDGWWPTPEPPHRINQIYLEPILARAVAAHPLISIRYRAEATDFTQDSSGVAVKGHSLETGEPFSIKGEFLIGCDGGRSPTRKAIGAELHGDAVIQRVQSTDILAPSLLERLQAPPAWAMFSLNPRRSGNVYAIDGRQRWLVHNYLRPEDADFESVDREACIRAILGVDDDFAFEIINKEDWFGRRLVADKLRRERIFICGDAAHLWVPYAGYGMNAGIADAANLAWMLGAHLNGWAPYEILTAYEAERLPITEQVSHFAMDHAVAMARQRGTVPEEIEDETPAGIEARAQLGRQAYALNVQQYCCAGLNFGYYYDRSPIIAYDGAQQPAYSMAHYTPSTVPGCRMPHFWLDDGRSLYDAIGSGFALLRLDESLDVAPLELAATETKIPFVSLAIARRLLDNDGPVEHCLFIVRPDQHVAWRGSELPQDCRSLLSSLVGRQCATADQ